MVEHVFKVDTRLASLLSENYRSSEKALKELIDNAWDADASVVSIDLPEPMSDDPIAIEDDGAGMTEQELASEYLNIARNRRSRSGEFTPGKKRQVKGRKGIGKFAGFMAASSMKLETWARGKKTEFELDDNLLQLHSDLSQVPLNARASDDNEKESGTRITLTNLHRHIRFPSPDKLRQILLQEYGRESGFRLIVNGKVLGIDDISGLYTNKSKKVESVGEVNLRFTISEQKTSLRQPGIVLRVAGKTIGEPSFFGLDKAEDFPPKLLNKCFGELEADCLIDDVTADWGAILDGSDKFEKIETVVQPLLREKFEEVYGQEIHLAKARLKKKVVERLSSLPEYKREFADKAIKKILERFYQEPDSKVEPIVNVLLDALERSDYRTVLEHINEARNSEVARFAEALDEFGLLEMTRTAEQAQKRLEFLDYLEQLCNKSSTLEKDVHKSIEKNLWLFGPEYTFFSSNITLKTQIESYLGTKYKGDRADKRPDLMLGQNLNGERLLIEFKRPSHSLHYEDYQQATAYRNDFYKNGIDSQINVIVMGGKLSSNLPAQERREPHVSIMTFSDLISAARRQYQWLLVEGSDF